MVHHILSLHNLLLALLKVYVFEYLVSQLLVITKHCAAAVIANNKDDVLHAEMLRTKAGNTIDRGIVRFKTVPSLLCKIEHSFIRIGQYHLRFHFLDTHQCSLCNTRGHTQSQCDKLIPSSSKETNESIVSVTPPIIPSQSVKSIPTHDTSGKTTSERSVTPTNIVSRSKTSQGNEKEKDGSRGKSRVNTGGTFKKAISTNYSPPPSSGEIDINVRKVK